MTNVITTRDIPTLGGVIRAGVLLSVVSWGEDGAANLVGLNGWPRVSMAAAESFEVADAGNQPSAVSHQHFSTTETRRHGGESHIGERLQVVPVEAEMPVGKEGTTPVRGHTLASDWGSADGTSFTIPTATASEPDKFLSHPATSDLREPMGLTVLTMPVIAQPFPSVPLCLRGSSDSGHQQSATSHQPPPQQETSHDQSRSVRVTTTHDTAGDRGRDPQAVAPSGGDGLRDDSEACPFEAQRVSGLHREVSRNGEQAPRPTVGDINAELAASGGERFELTRELREQVRFARPVSGGRDGWPVMRAGNKTPEQLAITVDPEAVGMPSFPRSSWHPNRSHWPELWRIAEYGTAGVGGRLLWNADHPDHRYEDKEWVCHVDLNTGEFKAPFHPWQKIDSTTEARRHGDEVGIPCSTELEGTGANIASVDCVESRNPEVIDISTRQDKASGVEMSCPDLPSSGHQPSAISQWHAPHDGMTLDERRGHRRVRNERGDIVWRCGPGPGETLAEFIAWKTRLDEFFEQDGTNETHTLRAVTMSVIHRSKEKIQCG